MRESLAVNRLASLNKSTVAIGDVNLYQVHHYHEVDMSEDGTYRQTSEVYRYTLTDTRYYPRDKLKYTNLIWNEIPHKYTNHKSIVDDVISTAKIS